MAFTPGPFCFFPLSFHPKCICKFPSGHFVSHCTTVRLAGADALTGILTKTTESQQISVLLPLPGDQTPQLMLGKFKAFFFFSRHSIARSAWISEALCHIYRQKPTAQKAWSNSGRGKSKQKKKNSPMGRNLEQVLHHTPLPPGPTPTSGG